MQTANANVNHLTWLNTPIIIPKSHTVIIQHSNSHHHRFHHIQLYVIYLKTISSREADEEHSRPHNLPQQQITSETMIILYRNPSSSTTRANNTLRPHSFIIEISIKENSPTWCVLHCCVEHQKAQIFHQQQWPMWLFSICHHCNASTEVTN